MDCRVMEHPRRACRHQEGKLAVFRFGERECGGGGGWRRCIELGVCLSFSLSTELGSRAGKPWMAVAGGCGRESENVLVLSRVGTLPPPPKMFLSE